jgi:hypothetical protein
MVSGWAVAYTSAGGIILFSAVKGATIADTVKAVLKGNLNVKDTETVDFGGGTAAAGDTGAASQSAEKNQALAKTLAVSMGFGDWTKGQEWADWVSLWNQESGWSNTAENGSSGAYGIPQALPPSKMPAKAQKPPAGTSDPGTQITWGIQYISGRYGSPSLAWAHEVENNWY